MPSLTLPDDRLIWFAHVPKAGGTSVEQAMVARWGARVGHLHWGWDLWWRGGGWREADPPNSPQHLIWTDAAPRLGRAPDAVFALVRAPHDRLASEHRYQRHARRATWAGRALAWLPFEVWLRLMLAVADRAPYTFDNHLRPQDDFIPEGAAVFRLEDGMGPVAAWIGQATGAAAPDIGQALGTGRACALPRHLRARIESAHEVDYERFGYEKQAFRPVERGLFDRLAKGLAPLVIWADRRGLL